MFKKSSTLLSIFLLLLTIAASTGSADVFAESSIFAEPEYTVDVQNYYFAVDFQEDVEVTEVKSSNTKVVSVDDIYNDFVYVIIEDVGTATLTAKDSNGNTDTCKIVVTPLEFVLSETAVSFNDYDTDDYDNSRRIYSETNDIKAVTSSDMSVAKATLADKDSFDIRAIAKGNAVITVKDIYNQTTTVNVEVTQKYNDEKTYLEIMEGMCEYTGIHYGADELILSSNYSRAKDIDIIVRINGVDYYGRHGFSYGDYTYTISNIPPLAVGTKVQYYLSAGEAVYKYEETVLPGDIEDEASIYYGNDYDYEYSHVYTGKPITPKIVLDDYYDLELKEGRDYKVSFSNNVNVGFAKVTVKGIGNFKGTLTDTFTIKPKGTSIGKLSPGKRTVTVKWKKQSAKMKKSRIAGYQIRYSTKKNMSGAKMVKVKGYSKTSKKIGKLKAKQKYYVQIRTYKTVNKKDCYSSWSAKKSVKVK